MHLIRGGSVPSIDAVGMESGNEVCFDELFRFVDTIREALLTHIIGEDDFERLKEIIQVLLENECEKSDEKATLSLISRTRFDKLLVELVNLETANPEYMGLITKATSLERLWKERFKDDYSLIDKERLGIMFKRGALHGLTLEIDVETKLPLWRVERGAPIAAADLKPGQQVTWSSQRLSVLTEKLQLLAEHRMCLPRWGC